VAETTFDWRPGAVVERLSGWRKSVPEPSAVTVGRRNDFAVFVTARAWSTRATAAFRSWFPAAVCASRSFRTASLKTVHHAPFGRASAGAAVFAAATGPFTSGDEVDSENEAGTSLPLPRSARL